MTSAPGIEVGDVVCIPGMRARYRVRAISDGGGDGAQLHLRRIEHIGCEDEPLNKKLPYWRCRKVPRPNL